MVKSPDPGPRVTVPVVFRVFTETIETEGEASNAPKIDAAKLEAAVKRVEGVTQFSFDPEKREVTIAYGGFAKDIKDLRVAIEGQGVSCEATHPARVVVRPVGVVEKPGNVLSAIKTVAGVIDVAREGNDFIAYSNLETLSLEALSKAMEGAGFKCQFPSHEEVKVKYRASGDANALKAELLKTRWVLRADVDTDEGSVKVLAARGRVTRAVVKTIMGKHGFPEAK